MGCESLRSGLWDVNDGMYVKVLTVSQKVVIEGKIQKLPFPNQL